MPNTWYLPKSTTPDKFIEHAPERVVVVSDDNFDKAIAAADIQPVDLEETDYAHLGWLGFIIGGPIGAGVGLLAGAVIEGVTSAKADKKRHYIIVSNSTAKKAQFPLAHPKDNVVYLRHPLVNTIYYPIAEFNQYLFQHKHLEARRLLRSLGATAFTLQCERGWSSEQLAHLSIAPGGGVELGGKASRKQVTSLKVRSSEELTPPRTRSIPADLVWFQGEADWKDCADFALNYRGTSYDLQVTSSDSFGVGASVKAEIAKLGFDVGGEFQEQQTTIWTISAKFAKRPKQRASRKSPSNPTSAKKRPIAKASSKRAKAKAV